MSDQRNGSFHLLVPYCVPGMGQSFRCATHLIQAISLSARPLSLLYRFKNQGKWQGGNQGQATGAPRAQNLRKLVEISLPVRGLILQFQGWRVRTSLNFVAPHCILALAGDLASAIQLASDSTGI